MQSAHIELITVSREFGAGGSELARKLGERLGWPVLDDEVACRCAQRLQYRYIGGGAAARTLAHAARATLRRAARRAARGARHRHARICSASMRSRRRRWSPSRKPRESLPLIVVGFGTQCIFADRADALHVRLVAPMPVRVERLRERFGWDAATAATRARRMDEDRRRYVQRYFHRDVHDPLLYDVQINTGRTTIDEAAAMIEQLVRGESTRGCECGREPQARSERDRVIPHGAASRVAT